MKRTFALVIVLAWITSLASLPLAAKVRRGSLVVVTLTDGRQVTGELLAVRGRDLIVHDRVKDQGLLVPVDLACSIQIKKQSGVRKGMTTGLVAGLVVGCLFMASEAGRDQRRHDTFPPLYALALIPVSTAIGTLAGGVASVTKKMNLEKLDPAQVDEWLRYLRKQARYPSVDPRGSAEPLENLPGNGQQGAMEEWK